MKRKLALAFAVALSLTAYAKDLDVKLFPDHDLWWEAPESPKIRISVRDTMGNQNRSRLNLRVTTDRDETKALTNITRDLNLPPGTDQEITYTINFNMPGFYKCFIEDDGEVIKQFNIGYEPELVFSTPDSKPDFDKFWADALAELAQVPGNYTITEDKEKSGNLRKAYAVSMQSLGNETIKGYLYVPLAPGKYPAHIYYNGYGGKPWPFDVDGRPDWIEFVASVRGQMYSEPDNTYGDWLRYNLDKPSEYYYRGAYMDVIRVIDFIEQLPQTDTEHIFAEGGSQGGALTLVAAALDKRLCAIAPYIPFLSDFKDYFNIVSWPASAYYEAQKDLGMSRSELFNNLTYFDVKNFARKITCPVLMAIGLQDPTCPPHTNMASYTLIRSPKQLIIYPECGHTVDYADWNPRREAFFKSQMSK